MVVRSNASVLDREERGSGPGSIQQAYIHFFEFNVYIVVKIRLYNEYRSTDCQGRWSKHAR